MLPPLGPEPSASTNFATWAGAFEAETEIIAGRRSVSSISRKHSRDGRHARAGAWRASRSRPPGGA
ncbi:hypothetical protein BCAR13_1070031 [Paraburkholderia caribensis]|nr:hypothetical protein BCAR13_1070031 [Paraburkholderia caribensis]